MITPRLFARAAALLAAATSTALAQSPVAGLDAYVAKGVKDWNVPGLAISIVKNDSVVFAKGYGVRQLGTHDSVNTHTLFANASTTKAFTAFVVEMLADEGKLRMDGPVIEYMPAFHLSDPIATRQITIADLLSHRTGVPEADYLWYQDTSSFPEIMRRLSYVPFDAPVRSHFEYQNITYALAGEIAALRANAPWATLVRDRILTPLGMRETTTGTPEVRTHPNVVSGHDYVHDTLRAIPRDDADNIAPAGAMYSSVNDMSLWIRFLLDSARLGGKRVLSPRGYADLFAPHILVDDKEFYPTSKLTHPHFQAYGQGWFLEDYRGEFVAFHTGSIDGLSAIVGLIPAKRLGVVIFANRDHAELRQALMYTVFDRFLGHPTHDWSAEMLPNVRGIGRGAKGRGAPDRSSACDGNEAVVATRAIRGGVQRQRVRHREHRAQGREAGRDLQPARIRDARALALRQLHGLLEQGLSRAPAHDVPFRGRRLDHGAVDGRRRVPQTRADQELTFNDPHPIHGMKFIVLIYNDPELLAALPQTEFDTQMRGMPLQGGRAEARGEADRVADAQVAEHREVDPRAQRPSDDA